MNNKWLRALWYDLIGRESESPLSKEERLEYTLVASALCGMASLASLWVHWLLALGFAIIGLRKLHIYLHKTGRIQW